MKANMDYETLRNSMSVQDAVRVLKETNCYGTMDIAKNVILEALETQPRWIPVSERLPEKNVEVLATTEWGTITIAERCGESCWLIYEGDATADTDEITAWMPLPLPWKTESEE